MCALKKLETIFYCWVFIDSLILIKFENFYKSMITKFNWIQNTWILLGRLEIFCGKLDQLWCCSQAIWVKHSYGSQESACISQERYSRDNAETIHTERVSVEINQCLNFDALKMFEIRNFRLLPGNDEYN